MENEEVIEEIAEEEVVEPEKPKESDPKVIERARRQGWVPKDEFRGDDSRWITAEQFVERADNMMPILKSVNAKLEGKLEILEKELKEQKELAKKMIKIHGKYADGFYDSRLTEIKTKKIAAVKEGDIELYQALEAEEAKIEKPEPIVIDEPAQQDHPDVARWKQDNARWYGSDPELTEYADIIADRMAKKGHSYREYEFCNAVKDKVMKMFPDKFKNPAQEHSSVDEPGTRGTDTAKGKKKGWSDLPADAKKQCTEFVATIPGYTKEKYLKDYFEEA